MATGGERMNDYQEYETLKQKLIKQEMTAVEYEAAIKKLCEELKI